jgi:hypothetical protein
MLRFRRKNILPLSTGDLYTEFKSILFYKICGILLILFLLYGLLLYDFIHWFIYLLGTFLCIIKIFYVKQFFSNRYNHQILETTHFKTI